MSPSSSPPTTAIKTEAYVSRGPRPSNPDSPEDGSKLFTLESITYDAIGPTEVLVETVAVGICHSDVKAAEGRFHTKPPMIAGHEGSGYVKQIGSAVRYVQPGDAVTLSYAHCGQCMRCLSGRQPYCEKIFPLNFGAQREQAPASSPAEQSHHQATTATDQHGQRLNNFFFGQSSLARLCLVRESSLVKLTDVSREELKAFAPLGCGVQTGAGAILNVLRPPPRSSIAIWGAGMVGLSALLAARLTDPRHLIVVDTSETKLASLPGDWVMERICAAGRAPGEVAEMIRRITGKGGGVDYAIDAVGSGAVLAEAHDALVPGGTVVTLGGSTQTPGFPIEKHLGKGAVYRGTHQGDSVARVMIPQLIALWREGKFPFEKLLTFFPFEDVDEALRQTREGKVVKPVLVID